MAACGCWENTDADTARRKEKAVKGGYAGKVLFVDLTNPFRYAIRKIQGIAMSLL